MENEKTAKLSKISIERVHIVRETPEGRQMMRHVRAKVLLKNVQSPKRIQRITPV